MNLAVYDMTGMMNGVVPYVILAVFLIMIADWAISFFAPAEDTKADNYSSDNIDEDLDPNFVGIVHSLPPYCPHCGGSIINEKINWNDSINAICPYCGSVVNTLE